MPRPRKPKEEPVTPALPEPTPEVTPAAPESGTPTLYPGIRRIDH